MPLSKQQYILILLAITVLFGFRVAAQLATLYFPAITLLPAFEQWHSGLLSYPALLTSQLAILTTLAFMVYRIATRTLLANHRLGLILRNIGLTYFGLMLLRLSLGLSILTESRFFANYLTTSFHLLLAAAVLTLAHYHLFNKENSQ